VSFYKTNDDKVLRAWSWTSAAVKALRAATDDFAAQYGGTGHNYSDPVRFAGIRFNPPKPRALWRCPDKHGLQVPRSAPLKGATADEKAALKALQAEWDVHVPDAQVTWEKVHRALDVSWGDFVFTGLTMFEHNGWLYAKTGAPMPRMTEILGSEFEAAQVAAKAAA